MSDMAVVMRDVSKAFRGVPALTKVTWHVRRGSVHGLIGANGAGKTTMLRLALGVLWPDVGDISVLDEQLARENAAIRQRVHYVASGRPLVPSFRVEEWVRYASLLYQAWDQALCNRLLKALELKAGATIRHLSSGQQTSLQLAVAIASHPQLMLLDEPTNGLDVVVKRQMLQFIIDMAADQGTTLVIATHNIEDIERLADTVSILYRGRMIVEEELETLKGSMHRLQVVMADWRPGLLEDGRIIAVERHGRTAVITVQGPAEPMKEYFRAVGADNVECLDLDLTEIFRVILAKEGYSREALNWESL
ncbi:ABC transporter ATP-binding protein [Sulfobacillus harzensis]|uniref:ABC transporter ATP-binding protein n=1 Tax=Sulfobacillus harzensis TaxID=2729629 RepID=A0A7Y0Q1J4_9FIRM|nr:ABC transporter ATP-binding protein [Sulfobacillus harzensis]NMP20896.1 ABC transporter ATP-binding protein [Sulfobacillus harzensis]